MNNDKSFIRHEILNIITLVNFLIVDSGLKEGERFEILQHLKMLGLLCSQGDFILGKKKKFSRRDVQLSEVMDLTEAILKESRKKAKSRVIFPKTKLLVKGDRDVIMSGLESILIELLPLTKKIELKINEKSGKLSLLYESEQSLKTSKLSLIDLLKDGAKWREVFFEVHVRLLNMSGVRTNFKKGIVEILF